MLQDTIRELIESAIEAEHLELVDVECVKMHSRWIIRLFIDKEGGVTLGDCQAISHLAGDILDVHETPPGAYTLEVSSPGLDRALTRDRDFTRFQGRRIKVKTAEKIDGGRTFYGILVDYPLEEGKKYLILDTELKTLRIPKEQILKVQLDSHAEALSKEPCHGKKTGKKSS